MDYDIGVKLADFRIREESFCSRKDVEVEECYVQQL
jgi:hypothetical protein